FEASPSNPPRPPRVQHPPRQGPLKRRGFSHDASDVVRSTPRRIRAAFAALAAAGGVCAGGGAAGAAADGGVAVVLGSAGQVRALAAADADRALPVKLRATVTFVSENHAFLFVQDASDGIFVDTIDVPLGGARVGDGALIEGVTASGLFAPQVRLRRYASLGPGALPPPQPTTYAELASGKVDSRLVTLQGTVRSI